MHVCVCVFVCMCASLFLKVTHNREMIPSSIATQYVHILKYLGCCHMSTVLDVFSIFSHTVKALINARVFIRIVTFHREEGGRF